MLNAPGGSPASSQIRASASAESGVALAGFKTTVQPAASAGAIFRVTMVAGKFQGVMAPTTPIGCFITHNRFSATGGETISPCTRRASSANQLKYPVANATSRVASSSGLPFSWVTSLARVSRRSVIKS
jgi:hypothetical protein